MHSPFGSTVLVNVNDCIEQLLKTLFGFGNYGNHRHTGKLAQTHVIELRAAFSVLIVHIKGHHGFKVDVNQLCGKIEVPLQVG